MKKYEVGDKITFKDVEDSESSKSSSKNNKKGVIVRLKAGNLAVVKFDDRKNNATINLNQVLKEDDMGGTDPGAGGVGTGDMAQGDSKLKQRPAARIEPTKSFKGVPCFNIEKSDEYHSFCKGIKTFKQWGQHTKSQDIRGWANQNKGKSFYVSHNENYTYIDRSKK